MHVCTHINIFYHMKTAVSNFLISYFIMKLRGLEKQKTFYILEIILEAHFYNDVISFLRK